MLKLAFALKHSRISYKRSRKGIVPRRKAAGPGRGGARAAGTGLLVARAPGRTEGITGTFTRDRNANRLGLSLGIISRGEGRGGDEWNEWTRPFASGISSLPNCQFLQNSPFIDVNTESMK